MQGVPPSVRPTRTKFDYDHGNITYQMFSSAAAGVLNTVSGFLRLSGTGEENVDPDKSVVFTSDGVPAHLDLAIPAPYVHISYINCKKHSIDCTNVLMFVLSILIHPKVVQECY